MKKSGFLILASVLIVAGCAAAGDQQKSQQGMMMGGMMSNDHVMMDMQKMDANGDGVISKDEFMKFHEAMFDMMKNKDGVINAKNMAMHCNMMGGMMGHGSMMGHGNMDEERMGRPNR